MREKLRDERGLTLVEMLCAAVILIILGLMVNTGLQMAVRSYQSAAAQSELQLLLSSLSNALADDLRYAREEIVTGAGGTLVSYSSDSYGTNTSLGIGDNGQVMAGTESGAKRVLPSAAYGNGAYEVKEMGITYESEGFFHIELKVGQAEGAISAKTDFTVRCLNGPKPVIAAGEEAGG